MTDQEFLELGNHLGELWPGFALSGAQVQIWRQELLHLPVATVRAAIGRAYAASTWREPSLGAVLEASRAIRKLDCGVAHVPAIPQEKVQQMIEEDRRRRREFLRRNGTIPTGDSSCPEKPVTDPTLTKPRRRTSAPPLPVSPRSPAPAS